MERIKLTLAIILTALCWVSLCLGWDTMMYASGFTAIIVIGLMDRGNKKERNQSKEGRP